MSEFIKANLNLNVRVKLTNYGRKIYYQQNDEMNERYGKEIIKPKYPKEDEDGCYTTQLWSLINLYGEYLRACAKLPFESEILIQKPN